MSQFILALLSAVRVFFRSRHDTALEILALRQQVAVRKRTRPRPRLSPWDRLFWTTLRVSLASDLLVRPSPPEWEGSRGRSLHGPGSCHRLHSTNAFQTLPFRRSRCHRGCRSAGLCTDGCENRRPKAPAELTRLRAESSRSALNRDAQNPRIWPLRAVCCEITRRDFPHLNMWLPTEPRRTRLKTVVLAINLGKEAQFSVRRFWRPRCLNSFRTAGANKDGSGRVKGSW